MKKKTKQLVQETTKLDYLIDVSLDQKVDKYLIEYERSAVLGPPSLPNAQPSPTVGAQQLAVDTGKFPTAPQTQPAVQTSSIIAIKKLVESRQVLLPIMLTNEHPNDVFAERLHEEIKLPIEVLEPSIKEMAQEQVNDLTVLALSSKFFNVDLIGLPVAPVSSKESVTMTTEGKARINEADAPDASADATATPDPTAGGDDPTAMPDVGGEDPTADAGGGADPKKENLPDKPKINLSLLARSMAKLISGYEYLIDPKKVIYNRCKAFIKINYGEQVANQFEKILKIEFNIDPYESQPAQNTTPDSYTAGSGSSDGGSIGTASSE